MHYEQGNRGDGWRSISIWLSPEVVDALEIVKGKNPRASTSEVVSRCLAEASEIPSEASGPDVAFSGILERLARVEDEVAQLRGQGHRATTRNRTTVKKVELARTVAGWMARNNKRGIHTVDPGQVWQELKSQGVVVHSTHQNFGLWFKRNQDRIKAEVRKA